MATKVSVTAGKAGAADCEISGGRDATIGAGRYVYGRGGRDWRDDSVSHRAAGDRRRYRQGGGRGGGSRAGRRQRQACREREDPQDGEGQEGRRKGAGEVSRGWFDCDKRTQIERLSEGVQVLIEHDRTNEVFIQAQGDTMREMARRIASRKEE